MVRTDYLSPSTRGSFRGLMTNSTLGAIHDAFHDEGFSRDQNCQWEDSSSRRTLTEEYLCGVNWADPTVYPPAIRVIQRLLGTVRPDGLQDYPAWDTFVGFMSADGWDVDDKGTITQNHEPLLLAADAIAAIEDPEALTEQVERLRRAVSADDPAHVIGTAKELVETVAKVALNQAGMPYEDGWKFPKLIGAAQEALGLHPGLKTPGPDGHEATKRILSGAMNMVLGLDELRNDYGTGHGAGRPRIGLHRRHARLAANAAVTWCELILETLADERAPWTARMAQVGSPGTGGMAATPGPGSEPLVEEPKGGPNLIR